MNEKTKPNTDRKLLTKIQRDNMSDSTADGSYVPKNRRSLIEIPYVEDYLIDPYKIYFAVSTDEVIERVKDFIASF